MTAGLFTKTGGLHQDNVGERSGSVAALNFLVRFGRSGVFMTGKCTFESSSGGLLSCFPDGRGAESMAQSSALSRQKRGSTVPHPMVLHRSCDLPPHLQFSELLSGLPMSTGELTLYAESKKPIPIMATWYA
jgi:hypothetical protein